jgi:hypothetical protein
MLQYILVNKMSYFTLPKINSIITVEPRDNMTNNAEYISSSLLNYYNEMKDQINNIFLCNDDLSNNNYNELVKIVNPYEFIFSRVPGSKFSVSKLKPKSILFYDFLEVCLSLNIFDLYKLNSIKTMHFTNNTNDTIECLEMLRENYVDENLFYNYINDDLITSIGDKKVDFLFFETNFIDNNQYIISLIQSLMVIFKNQSLAGSCIIKINSIFYKPIIDIIYILSSLYEKTYILKPNTSNVTTFDKYIVCKNFITNNDKNTTFRLNYFKLLSFLKNLNGKNILSILNFEIPYYFKMKLDDINIIFGQQQLESLDLIINILKNKNKEDKIETIKKTNIQKSVAWCEKYKIPCNKFSEKTNIFLPINKESNEPVEESSSI